MPNIEALTDDDGYKDPATWEQFGYNIMFNLGFMIQDGIWMWQVTDAETDWWYRNGFVAGDFYMRFFYRTVRNFEVK
jgi:hypothetical protein